METTVVIPLGDGLEAIVDRADEALLAGFNWRPLRLLNVTYAHSWHRKLHLYMHRLIIGAGADQIVDHQNGDGLDNRLLNLRITTKSGNGANRGKDHARTRSAFTSQYKGVFWDKQRGKWAVMIHHGKTRSLGRFDDEQTAARAYDEGARETWGEFARVNFP